MNSPMLLQIDDLRTQFRSEGAVVKAVDGVSLSLACSETLGLVGESGSGKSVTALSVLRLLPPASATIASGRIVFLGQDLVKTSQRDLRTVRGHQISMIFQEPGTSLNPVFKVSFQIMESIRRTGRIDSRAAYQKCLDLLHEVGIRDPRRVAESFPHQLSGGQKQRVMIAMALSSDPSILIADEPTTALDVTVQAQILDLLRTLRDQRQMAILFISHDLGVISEIADRIAVMYRGKIVETGPVLDIFRSPKHPYTKGLLACRPTLHQTARRLLTVADYMDVQEKPDGQLDIQSKAVSDERLNELARSGRPPLLHPKRELEAIPNWDESRLSPDSTYISPDATPILDVQRLRVFFPIRKGVFRTQVGEVKAVDDISFRVYKGQTLGLVGESGCGKTTTGRAILRLVPMTSGSIFFEGKDFLRESGASLRALRRRMQVIFQDPYGSLNPRLTVETALTQPMRIHRIGSNSADRRARAASLLEECGLSAEHLGRYPHEFSGGQRQRLCIARALAVEPDFVICDESVSALDVSVQSQVLNLLKDLQQRRGLTYIFISHDLAVVKFMADMMAVMNAGKIVEFGPSELVYSNPQNEYTRKLISAIPDASIEAISARQQKRVS